MRSISIPWSSLFRRSLKVISTFFTSFLAWALLLYNIWAHCTCKLLDWGFTSFVANDSLTHTLISREECTDLATTVALRKGIWAQSRYKKRRRQKQTREIMADFFCSETADSKNICILYDNAAALILSLTARIARQKKQKKPTAPTAQVPVFWKVLKTFRAWNASRQIEIHLFWKAGLLTYFFNIWKTKRIAKFDGREPWRCEDLNRIATSQNRHKEFRDVWERGPRSNFLRSVPPGTSGHYNFVQASSQKSLSCIL